MIKVDPVVIINSTYPSNFRKVDDFLMRSAQPDAGEIRFLQKKENLTDIINFRTLMVPKTDFDEATLAKELNLGYANLPTASLHPCAEKADRFLKHVEELKKTPHKKVLAHCRAGADRTGMYVLLYELKYKLKSVPDAVAEMLQMGHNKDLYKNMIDDTLKIARALGILN